MYTEDSPCFNGTHYSDSGYTIYEGEYVNVGEGDAMTCGIERDCDDSSVCSGCSNGAQYSRLTVEGPSVVVTFLIIFAL